MLENGWMDGESILNVFLPQDFRSQYCIAVWGTHTHDPGRVCESKELSHYPSLVTEGNLQLGRAAYIVFQVSFSAFNCESNKESGYWGTG